MKNFVRAIDKVANSANITEICEVDSPCSSVTWMAAQIYAGLKLIKKQIVQLRFFVLMMQNWLIKEPSSLLTKNHELLMYGFTII